MLLGDGRILLARETNGRRAHLSQHEVLGEQLQESFVSVLGLIYRLEGMEVILSQNIAQEAVAPLK